MTRSLWIREPGTVSEIAAQAAENWRANGTGTVIASLHGAVALGSQAQRIEPSVRQTAGNVAVLPQGCHCGCHCGHCRCRYVGWWVRVSRR